MILYPPDRLNEKFLIKIRQCILKLAENHPVKQWLKNVVSVEKLSAEDQKKATFLTEILTSKFNLITDLAVKNRIIEILINVPENTMAEKLLKSYLYLMIGNVTRSDNVLKEIMDDPPVRNWEGYSSSHTIYHNVTIDNLSAVIAKIARHPSDRKTWELFSLYLREFTNDEKLIEELNEHDGSQLNGKLQLLSVERISPEFIHYLRFRRIGENRISSRLRGSKLTTTAKAYWIWYFMKIDSAISEEFLPELSSIEEKDPLWFMFLMENEKLSDYYSTKTGKAFLPGKRQLLREKLQEKNQFMVSLWKLIELGDIDQKLVNDTATFLSHD